jgi:putative methyltransferase
MKILLADLAHTASVEDASLTVPLNIGFIKAYLERRHGRAVEVGLFKHPERLLEAATTERPQIVGFSNYGWNDKLNQAIGGYLRAALPDALIVAGGPNVDPDPARRRAFLRRHAYIDLLIVDGGEEPMAELVEWWGGGGRDYGRLPGNLVWLDGDEVRATGERPLTKAIRDIPSPYLGGGLDEFLARGMIPMFETNRGCPFRCTFCAWGMASKDLVRRFDLDMALEDIAYVSARSRSRNWIFCDANFGILKRDVEIAQAIRDARERTGFPSKCHIWLAKNVTERNLEIGAILGDMTVPVMAVQSLDEAVLANIKRDNISTDTYVEYQKRFHAQGSRTYSDLIVPLPAETRASHLAGLRSLFAFGVDIIQNHNMRLLAGAETNSTETRRRFGFRTRFRLIHGDAGAYRAPDGTVLRCFEYEESLRQTATMSEADLFFLRKLHFLVDFAWNIEVYRPLLKALLSYGVNPVDALQRFLETAEASDGPIARFFADFDRRSGDEWFDSAEAIEARFADPREFQRLLDQEFEKLNILFSVIALKDYKHDFDRAMKRAAQSFGKVPRAVLDPVAALSFAAFPPLGSTRRERVVQAPGNLDALSPDSAAGFVPDHEPRAYRFVEGPRRRELRRLIAGAQSRTLSKILNTQGITLRDLRFTVTQEFAHDGGFRRG